MVELAGQVQSAGPLAHLDVQEVEVKGGPAGLHRPAQVVRRGEGHDLRLDAQGAENVPAQPGDLIPLHGLVLAQRHTVCGHGCPRSLPPLHTCRFSLIYHVDHLLEIVRAA